MRIDGENENEINSRLLQFYQRALNFTSSLQIFAMYESQKQKSLYNMWK
jgi:hypothetical protein